MEIGTPELAAIGLDLGVHLDRVAEDVHDFVSGGYRASEDAPNGTRLGDFGEALAYLLLKSANEDVLRVVGVDRGLATRIKGTKFPQPDFLVRRNGKSGCVEVKATSPLDFIFHTGVVQWKHLKPCDGVATCRSRALPQLGWPQPTKPRVAYAHHVRLRDKSTIPFPSDFGEAVGVLVHDARMNALEQDPRFRTPPTCRAKKRACWTCMRAGTAPAHLTAIWMPNAPGKLPLLGAGDTGDAWFRAYARWHQAVWSREVDGVTTTTRALAAVTSEWITAVSGPAVLAEEIALGWRHYMQSALGDRGLPAAAAEGVRFGPFDGASDQPGQVEMPARPDEPRVETVEHDAPLPFDTPERPRRISVRRGGADDAQDSFSLFLSKREWHVRLASNLWWRGGRVESLEAASLIAHRLLEIGMRLRQPGAGPPPDVERPEPRLVPLVARVGDNAVQLGWTMRDDLRWWWRLAGWPYIWPDDRWPELFVFPDGRGFLRATLDR